jgi:hypothetical protein
METCLDILLNKIRHGLIERICLSDTEIDLVLSQRDRDEFSEKWIIANKMIGALTNQDDLEIIQRIRHESFLKSFERWYSSDLAAYISDDMELIAKALCINSFDPWVNSLLVAYQMGKIPTSQSSIEGSIRETLHLDKH